MSTILVEHANGPRSVSNAEKRTIAALQKKGLIYLNRLHRPTRTVVVTQRGRKVIARRYELRGSGLQVPKPLLGDRPKSQLSDMRNVGRPRLMNG